MPSTCRQAILLVAGRGSRLAPLTDDRPKCLLAVGGTPLLERNIRALERAGVEHIVLGVGYRGADIAAAVKAFATKATVELVENPDWSTTNNAVSFALGRRLVRAPFLLADGDVWLATRVMEQLLTPDRIALAGRKEPRGSHGRVASGRVVDISGPGDDDSWLKTVNAASFSEGWWREWFEPALERLVVEAPAKAFYEEAMGRALRGGAPTLEPVVVGDRDWFEIDTPDDLAAANALLATGP